MDVKITTTKEESDEIEQVTYEDCEISIQNIKDKIFIFIEYKK